jgi:UDP:flavonoid glycosyltransferase YjiC (YdhE family)
MRFLMSFAGGYGHAAPMFPVARALIARGHDVAFTGQSSILAAVTHAGFETFDSAGTSVVQPAALSKFQAFDENALRDRMRGNFGDKMARERLIGVTRIASQWHPDAIICDELDFGGMLAAESLRVPHITLLVTASGRIVTPAWFAATIDRIRADNGLRPDPELRMITGNLILSPFPSELRDPRCTLSGDVVYFRADTTAAVIDHSAAGIRPRIYATFGTDFNALATDLFQTLLRGLATLDADIVATVGSNMDPGNFGAQPRNVDLRRFVDQADLLPSCSIMVSHGGSGSLLGGLAHGLPLLLLPLGADQPFNAERSQELGFAIALDPLTASPESIAAAATTLLQSAQYRDAARRLQGRLYEQAPAASVVARIEEAATTPRTFTRSTRGDEDPSELLTAAGS